MRPVGCSKTRSAARLTETRGSRGRAFDSASAASADRDPANTRRGACASSAFWTQEGTAVASGDAVVEDGSLAEAPRVSAVQLRLGWRRGLKGPQMQAAPRYVDPRRSPVGRRRGFPYAVILVRNSQALATPPVSATITGTTSTYSPSCTPSTSRMPETSSKIETIVVGVISWRVGAGCPACGGDRCFAAGRWGLVPMPLAAAAFTVEPSRLVPGPSACRSTWPFPRQDQSLDAGGFRARRARCP